MEEIMDNLINNAIKYSPKNKEIVISLEEKSTNFLLKIKDNDPGLSQKDKKYIFKQFSKLSAQPTDGETSTGLGLFIVKTLVKAHQGKIYVESDGKNKGSTFFVELPLKSTAVEPFQTLSTVN